MPIRQSCSAWRDCTISFYVRKKYGERVRNQAVEEALREYNEPLYDEAVMSEYIGIIKDKLHMDDKEFEIIMNPPVHQHSDYMTEDETV